MWKTATRTTRLSGSRVEYVPPQPFEGVAADGVRPVGQSARVAGVRVEDGRAGAVRVAGHGENGPRSEAEPERWRRCTVAEEGAPRGVYRNELGLG